MVIKKTMTSTLFVYAAEMASLLSVDKVLELLLDDDFSFQVLEVGKKSVKSVNRVTGMFVHLVECPTVVSEEVAVQIYFP